MKMSAEGRAMLEGFESCRLVAFQDGGGVWTLGWGRTQNVKKGDTCTQTQADAWRDTDIAIAEDAVNLYVRVLLRQGQFDALVDFAYNLGAGNLRSSTLLKMVNAKDWAGAAQQFLRWDHDGGVQVAGLTRRCKARKALFEEGEEG